MGLGWKDSENGNELIQWGRRAQLWGQLLLQSWPLEYPKMKEWMNHKSMKCTELLGECKREYKQMNPTVVKVNKYIEIREGRK